MVRQIGQKITPQKIGAIATSDKGSTNGVAVLGSDGKIPANQARSSSLSYNSATGVITFTDATGTTSTIDLPIENLFQNAAYSSTTRTLTLTTNGGGTIDIPLTDLVDLPEISAGTINPSESPSTGQKLYFRTDNGNYWLNVGGNWTGPFLSITQTEKDKLAGIATGATANATTDSLAEGSNNLYFTASRARNAISVTGVGGSYNSATGILTLTGSATGWVTQIDDTFDRANSTTIGNDWVNIASNGTPTIESNQIRLTRTAGIEPIMVRPTTENAVDQEATAYWTANSAYGAAVFVRLQTATDHYRVEINLNAATTAYVYKKVGGTQTTLVAGALSSAIVPGNYYSVRLRATGANPTTLTVEVKNITAGTTLYTNSAITDSASGLQVAGRTGISSAVDPYSYIDRFVNANLIGASSGGGGSSIASTSDLPEGTNLYYTAARARGAISVAGTGLSYNSATGVITGSLGSGGGTGGVATSTGYINIEDEGASSSSTDNTTAINNAIAKAASNGINAVLIPGKTYQVKNTINVYDGIYLFGVGASSCIKMTTFSQNGTDPRDWRHPYVVRIFGSNNTIENLRIQGPTGGTDNDYYPGSSGFGYGIIMQPSSGTAINNIVRNCVVQDCVYGGITAGSQKTCRIESNLVFNIPGSKQTDISCGGNNVTGDLCERVMVVNNFCLSNNDAGIYVAHWFLRDVICTNNMVIAMIKDMADYATGTGCKRRHGIHIAYNTASSSVERKLVCADNLIRFTNWTGIYCNDTPDLSVAQPCGENVITGNLITDIGQKSPAGTSSAGIVGGIAMMGMGMADIISGNVVRNTLDIVPGVRVTNSAASSTSKCRIDSNTFIECIAAADLSVLAKNTTFSNNTITNSAKADIQVYFSSGYTSDCRLNIEGNTIHRINIVDRAIVLNTSANTSQINIKNNKIYGSGATTANTQNAAIYCNTNDVFVKDNLIDGFYYGIYFNTYVNSRVTFLPLVDYNQFSNISGTAIRATSTTNAGLLLCEGNLFRSVAIKLDSAGFVGTKMDTRYVSQASAIPTKGTWAVGDVVWNTAPTANGTPGWVCVTAGNPGTWKAMASIAA